MFSILLPQPRQVEKHPGRYRVPAEPTVVFGPADAAEPARMLAGVLGGTVKRGGEGDVTVFRDAAMAADECSVEIARRGIAVKSGGVAGFRRAGFMLRQLLLGGRRLSCGIIHDKPVYGARGVYYDVARGRVPKTERLEELAETLAGYGINQLQLYVEHTFAWKAFPDIWRGASPLTAADIRRLDRVCARCGVELIPSLASFGHMAGILRLPPYRTMAEDRGVGRYTDPAIDRLPAWQRKTGWTISPVHPRTYRFLARLFDEFLPLFSSRIFNVCCDETWDLGYGQSAELCRLKGRGRVYLDHVLRLRELAARHGKRIQFWGDVIVKHPDLLSELPGDVTVLNWGYEHDVPLAPVRALSKARRDFMVCPGTSGWVSLFPRLPASCANIRRLAAAGRGRACGLLNTDWGDGGHYNFMELSWYGYLFGAEQAWNPEADAASFTDRFCRLFLRSSNRRLMSAIADLGDISHICVGGYYQSAWLHVFFAEPGADILRLVRPMASVSEGGAIRACRVDWDAAYARAVLSRVNRAKSGLESAMRVPGVDPMGVLPYWVFAADCLAHAARKLSVLGLGGTDVPAERQRLANEMRGLLERFETLWKARNRVSELRIAKERYMRALVGLERAGPVP
ncbi:MAG: hypothetical protein FJ224_12535 [Lentisphaerae bacterium]|nr:hypothetical protein [Lentisphaerota bacterium]